MPIEKGKCVKSCRCKDKKILMPKREMHYVINIPPKAWKRPAPAHNARRMFDLQKDEKLYSGLILSRQHGSEDMFCRPVELDIRFSMKWPQWMCEKGRQGATPAFKAYGDLDNHVKFLLDTLVDAKILSDDSIVVKLLAVKQFDVESKTDIVITELD